MVGLLVQLWRWWSLSASYDQGIFTQVLWNSGHGRWFASSLSSQLSSAVLHGGAAPDPAYQRLGQHYTPLLLLWAPLVRLLGAAALPLVQVGVITAAGLALHRLAKRLLPAGLAAAVACSFYGAQAVIGPTWCNFHDLCQLPLLDVIQPPIDHIKKTLAGDLIAAEALQGQVGGGQGRAQLVGHHAQQALLHAQP